MSDVRDLSLAIAGLLAAGCVALSGCHDPSRPPPPVPRTEESASLDGAEGFEDCRIARLITPHGMPNMYAVRCPNSSTTVRHNCGKSCTRNVATIDEKPIRDPDCNHAEYHEGWLVARLEADNKKPALNHRERDDLLALIHFLDDFTHSPHCVTSKEIATP